MPSFLRYSLEKRKLVALTVIDSQNNLPSESYGLEYTKPDFQCSHVILVDNSSHYLKIRVTLCSVGEGNCSFQLQRGLWSANIFPAESRQAVFLDSVYTNNILSTCVRCVQAPITVSGELDSVVITQVSSDTGDDLGCLSHPCCDSLVAPRNQQKTKTNLLWEVLEGTS